MAGFHFPEEATWKPAPPPNGVTVDRTNDPRTHWLLDPCTPTTNYPTDSQRLAMLTLTRLEGESFDGRQIAVYPDAAGAAELMAGFRRVLAACADAGSTEYFSAPAVLGDEALVEWHRFKTAPGVQWPAVGGYSVVMREGRSVYLAAIGGEIRPNGPDEPLAIELITAARATLPLPQ